GHPGLRRPGAAQHGGDLPPHRGLRRLAGGERPGRDPGQHPGFRAGPGGAGPHHQVRHPDRAHHPGHGAAPVPGVRRSGGGAPRGPRRVHPRLRLSRERRAVDRLRYWAEQALSTKSLVAAGAAAAGLVGWATTGNPAFGWLMLAGGGAWTAMMYYLGAAAKATPSLVPRREEALREVEGALKRYPVPRDEEGRAQWLKRETQLRRIVELEKLVLTELPSTPSGVGLLSPEQQLEVSEFVEQAIDLSRRRVLLIRALVNNPQSRVDEELRTLIRRRQDATDRVRGELDELIAL